MDRCKALDPEQPVDHLELSKQEKGREEHRERFERSYAASKSAKKCG